MAGTRGTQTAGPYDKRSGASQILYRVCGCGRDCPRTQCPEFLQSLGQEYDEKGDDDDSLDQTRGMYDLSSKVFPDHPVHGVTAPDDLDRSKAV